MKPLDQSILESIAVSVCFVEPDSNYVPPPPPSSSLSGITSYVISSNQLLDINEKIRGKTANILFEMDGEGVSLITLILDSLLKVLIFILFLSNQLNLFLIYSSALLILEGI